MFNNSSSSDSTDTQSLTDVHYVGESRVDALTENDVNSIAELAALTADEVQDIAQVGATDAARILDSARDISGVRADVTAASAKPTVDSAFVTDGVVDSPTDDTDDDDDTHVGTIRHITPARAGVLESMGIEKRGNLAMLKPALVASADNLGMNRTEAVEAILDAAAKSDIEPPHVALSETVVSTKSQQDIALDDYLDSIGGTDVAPHDGNGSVFTDGDLDSTTKKNLVVVSYGAHADRVSQKAFIDHCKQGFAAFREKHGWLPERVGMPAGDDAQAAVLDFTKRVEAQDASVDHAVFAFNTINDDAESDGQANTTAGGIDLTGHWRDIYQQRFHDMMDWADGVLVVVGDRDSDDCYVGKYISSAMNRNMDFCVGVNLDEE